MTIIVDFDHTVFNWFGFRTKLVKELERAFAIPPQTFFEAKKTVEKGGTLYNFHAHIREIARRSGIPYRKVQQRVQSLLQGFSRYLYPDAVCFLARAKKRGARLVLLTYGDRRNQKFFVELTGAKKYFDRIHIVQTESAKRSVVRKYAHRGERTIFVNDNPHETKRIMKKIPSVKRLEVILVERKNAKYFSIPRRGIQVIRALTAILPMLRQSSSRTQ